MKRKDDQKDSAAVADPAAGRLARRGLLAGSLIAAGGAVAAGTSRAFGATLTTAPWTKEPGAPLLEHPYGVPSRFESNVVRRTFPAPIPQVGAAWSPLADLHGTITPNGLFFVRDHAGTPDIDPDQHRLLVHGLVDRPMVFTMEDLTRFPAVSATHFLECSGNTFQDWAKPAAKTVQFSHGLLSCCQWTGVLLETILGETGVRPEATWLLAEGADAAAMDRSVPLADAFRIGALLAYAQNGESIRPEQGFPLRLVLPGFEGNMNIKWLRRLKLLNQPGMTKEETGYYTDLMPNGKARAFTFVMDAKSVITRPSGGIRLPAPGAYDITGLAWSGHGRITRVDVSVNGGESWQTATLQEPVLPRCLTRFRMPWRWDGGSAVLQSRAIDETGYVQPTLKELVAIRGVNSFYHNNAIQPWQIVSSGEVSNV
jgi:sulfane dehydrogenase subunit SoxC